MKQTFHTHLVYLTQIKLSREQINTLNLEFDCALEKDPKQFINTLIVDTENTIRHLDIKIQNTFRYLSTKKIDAENAIGHLDVKIQLITS